MAKKTSKKPSKKLTLDERRTAIKAKRDAYLAKQKVKEVPFDPSTILDTTKIGSKTVEQWHEHILKLTEKAIDKGEFILDLTTLPEWVTWAVNKWREAGKPSFKKKVKEDIEALLEKADLRERFAALDRSKATELGMSLPGIPQSRKAKVEEQRDKKLEAAAKKEEEAIAFRAEAEKLKERIAIKG